MTLPVVSYYSFDKVPPLVGVLVKRISPVALVGHGPVAELIHWFLEVVPRGLNESVYPYSTKQILLTICLKCCEST